MSKNTAIIDFGSARMKLNILLRDGGSEKYLNFKDETHLSSHVDENNVLNESYFISTFIPKLNEFIKIIKDNNVNTMMSVGTHIFRNLKNSEFALKELNKCIGHLNIISGELEGELFYKSVKNSVKDNDFVLMDIGGGSAQIIFDDKTYSFPTGTFTLEKEFQASKDSASEEELNKMSAHIKTFFKQINKDNVSNKLIFGSSCMRDFAEAAFANSSVEGVVDASEFIPVSKYNDLYNELKARPYNELADYYPDNKFLMYGIDKVLIHILAMADVFNITNVMPTNDSLSKALLKLIYDDKEYISNLGLITKDFY